MLEQLLRLLEREKIKLALEAMDAATGDQFQHGLQVGRYKGLIRAHELIEGMINEATEKEEQFERFA
jgi:hypothetical protein